MLTFFCQDGPVTNFEEAKHCDTARFSRFFHHLLERGIYFPPSQFEAAFLSTAYSLQDIAYTRQAIRDFS
jgi:glutamate-1-semialdehyde 2,1-aminomutase